MYETGTDRIEQEFDITRILVKLKKLDILIKKNLSTKEQRREALNDKTRVIYLDSDEETVQEP